MKPDPKPPPKEKKVKKPLKRTGLKKVPIWRGKKEPKPKRLKDKSQKWYKKEFDRVFSLWVRQRDADEYGKVNCCTCYKEFNWRYIQCGHYESRGRLSIRFFYKNTAPQCGGCNKWKGGNLDFALYLKRKYGDGVLEELEIERDKEVRYSRSDYKELIEDFTNRIIAFGGEIR